MSRAEYEITISPGGGVELNLIQEASVQSQACTTVQNLMASLGTVTEHDQRCEDPTPVNLKLNIPGSNQN